MESKKTFTPSADQVRLAELVLTCMARVQRIEPTVVGYKRQILRDGGWRVCPSKADNQVMPEIVLEPKLAFLLNETDLATYIERSRAAALAHGLTVREPGNCPLLEAEHDLQEARNALAHAMDGTSPIRLDQVVMMAPAQFVEYIELLLRLLAPSIGSASAILDGFLGRFSPRGAAA